MEAAAGYGLPRFMSGQEHAQDVPGIKLMRAPDWLQIETLLGKELNSEMGDSKLRRERRVFIKITTDPQGETEQDLSLREHVTPSDKLKSLPVA